MTKVGGEVGRRGLGLHGPQFPLDVAEAVAGCQLGQVAHVGPGGGLLGRRREREHGVDVEDTATLLFPHTREEPRAEAGAVTANSRLAV